MGSGLQVAEPTQAFALSALQRSYECQCSNAVFFRNSRCLQCGTTLGYEPRAGQIIPLAPGTEPGTWQLAGSPASLYRQCANRSTPAACNWLLPVDSESSVTQVYCVACRLNRTIPDLSIPENALLWGRIEDAKRYVISMLLALGLPVASKLTEDPAHGLMFDFLQSPENGPRVLTGHDEGVITLNIEEADDSRRENTRAIMHEPYRTLIGHFRHEVGHYYWDRLVDNRPWLAEFRKLFGDERADYQMALQMNYRQGPPADWQERHVSAYASVHPWEDWAETWAHYLHMLDTLSTANSFGLRPESISLPFDYFGPDALWESGEGSSSFLVLVNSWLKLTAVLNELCRSMGQADFYPFALPRLAVTKLHFVHLVVTLEVQSNAT